MTTSSGADAASAGVGPRPSRPGVDCSGCGYCLPCAQGIDIPRVLRMADQARRGDDDLARVRQQYRAWHDAWWQTRASQSAPAEACLACGDCQARCPAAIAIPQLLAEARDLLSP